MSLEPSSGAMKGQHIRYERQKLCHDFPLTPLYLIALEVMHYPNPRMITSDIP